MQPKRRTVAVHPNSMAARKWKRQTWQTALPVDEMRSPAEAERLRLSRTAGSKLFARAAAAARAGNFELANALRRRAMQQRHDSFICG